MQDTIKNLRTQFSMLGEEEPVFERLVQQGEIEKLAEYMSAGRDGMQAYASAFRARPMEERRALAYIYGVMLLNPQCGSPMHKFFAGRSPDAAIDVPPIVNRGMVGPSGMWPIYAVHPEFFAGRDCQLFYTDEDIADDANGAQHLADCIARESSGVVRAGVQQLTLLSWAGWVSDETVNAVVFSLSPEALKSELPIKGIMCPLYKEEPYVVVIPKHGEYRAILGEVRRFGKGQLHQVLASDEWCTK